MYQLSNRLSKINMFQIHVIVVYKSRKDLKEKPN